jgi:two-component system, OmpR family, sensor histidine kinase BaeS
MKKIGAFLTRLPGRLMTRLFVLIIMTGAVSLFGLFVLYVLSRNVVVHTSQPNLRWWVYLVRPGLELFVFIIIPLIILWAAARLVTRPLKRFNTAIRALQSNNYRVRLQPVGIAEFDDVFTSFNELIERLHDEEEVRKNLISDTSHELNTPLTALIGQLAAMQEGALPTDDERITVLRDQADRLGELIAQLDTYARARTPNTQLAQDVSLHAACMQAVNEVASSLHARHIVATVKVDVAIVVKGDQRALQQILANLLQNALRYSEATTITVSGDVTMLTIADNGKGVAAEKRAHLFERFYRVDSSRSRETGGLGLGLAIVKELVHQQGWTIRLDDARPGLAIIITF